MATDQEILLHVRAALEAAGFESIHDALKELRVTTVRSKRLLEAAFNMAEEIRQHRVRVFDRPDAWQSKSSVGNVEDILKEFNIIEEETECRKTT